MVRIITINNFVNRRNRFIFRWPLVDRETYDWRCKEFSTSAINTGNEYRQRILLKHFHLVKNVGHRFNSSSGDGGNITSFNLNTLPFRRKRTTGKSKRRISVTEILNNSSNVKQERVGLIRKNNLHRFVLESLSNSMQIKSTKYKSNDDNQSSVSTMTMNEKPFLFTPDNFEFDPVKHKTLIENLPNSLQEFMSRKATDERLMVDSETTTKAETVNDELQKQFQPDSFRYQASFKDSLKAYINACVTVDMTDRALFILNEYRRKSIDGKKIKLNDPELFVELMAKYADGKNLNKVNQIYSIMLQENVHVTPHFYMLMLSCMGRSPGNNKLIKKCIEMAAQKSISMNDIMDKSTFSGDQRSFALEAIRRHKPDFVPVYTPPNLEYDNELLNFLNANVRNIEEMPQSSIEDAEKLKISKSKAGFSPEQLEKFSNEQFTSENFGQIDVKNIQMMDPAICANRHVKKNRKLLDKLIVEWREQLKKSLALKLQMLQHRMRNTSTSHMNIYPYLKLLPPEELIEILLNEMMDMAQGSESFSQTVFHFYTRIGRKMLHKHQVNLRSQSGVNDKINKLYKTYSKVLCSGQCTQNPRELWQQIVHHSRGDGPCLLQKSIKWPWQVEINVGQTLFKMLAENTLINANILKPNKRLENVRVIYSIFLNRDITKSREEIRLHPAFIELYRESKFDTIKFNSNEIPMLCPPLPWTSIDNGGYLISHSDLVRLPYDCRKQIDMIRKAPPRQLYPPLDSLNQLGSVPWQINTRILDLAIKIFNLGGNEKLNVPLTPDNRITDNQLEYLGLTRNVLENRKKNRNNNNFYMQKQRDLFSLYSDTLLKLSLANHFRDRPFFLPHNMDFRGRVYPIPPHLTHLSADLTRAMLMFHQKQPLGRFGLDWLKLHCINLTGLMKRDSIQDRLIYAESVMSEIVDSAENPLSGRQWWLNSDEPWQTLAACMEIADAVRSSDPTKYMSSFPIHQDGSCNGLQHFAALGRDVDGAYSVNLSPAETPQDVYTTIANRVEECRKRDSELGDKVALALEGLIKRKIIKQTVMTTVYGVTKHGAMLQIKKQLKNIDFNPMLIDKAALYLVKATFGSLSETFKSAREIQDWFGECASVISKYNNQHVEWVSPLGLPIIQPYTRPMAYSSNAPLTQLRSEGPLNSMKEKNAFSPNFIHSLDSCHMMLTALNCERAGITFVSVHDCFWTHANTVPIMSRICREQFVLLHSQPILENLGESFHQKFKNVVRLEKKKSKAKDNKDSPPKDLFRSVPEKGKFDLKKVLESVYFFS